MIDGRQVTQSGETLDMTAANPPITPFGDESTSLMIGDLTVENRIDGVSLYGSLTVTRDRVGLRTAIELKALLDSIVAALQVDQALPERIATKPSDQVPNPF